MTACTPLLHKETVSTMNYVTLQVIVVWVLQKCSMISSNTTSVFRRLVQYLGPMAIDQCQWPMMRIEKVLQMLSLLQGLRKIRCCRITNEFAKHMPSQLDDIDLNGCSMLTNTMMIIIGQRCIQLQMVNLSNCTKIRNSCIAVLAHSCQHLRDIDLCGCHLVTIKGVMCIVKLRMNSIKRLGLAFCTKITANDITEIIDGIRLQYLDLRGLNPFVQDILQVVYNGSQLRLSVEESLCERSNDKVWRLNHNLLLNPEEDAILSWKEQKIMDLATYLLLNAKKSDVWKDLTPGLMKKFVISLRRTVIARLGR